MQRKFIAFLIIATVVGSSCGDDSNHSGTGGSHESASANGDVPGGPAEAADADRRIEVAAYDDLRFGPASIEVSANEAVTFIVTNEGKTEHEFVLGDETYQEMHESDMQQNDHMMQAENAVDVAPGETAEITWRFDEAGEVLFACHEPGHFEGGMIGSIQVT